MSIIEFTNCMIVNSYSVVRFINYYIDLLLIFKQYMSVLKYSLAP